MTEFWDILDRNGQHTGRTMKRGDDIASDDYHLVVHIWIMNNSGDLLIQKRSATVAWMPSTWATTGGSALSGENSLTAAIREVEEELGIRIPAENFKKIGRQIRPSSLTDIWLASSEVRESDTRLLPEEVAEVKWVTPKKLASMIGDKSFYDYGEEYWKILLSFSPSLIPA